MPQFSLTTARVLQVDLAGDSVRALSGAMVAYEGDVTFRRTSLGGGDGIRAALKRRVTGETLELMDCAGTGRVYFAKDAHQVELVALNGDTLSVESTALLAIDAGLRTDVTFTGLRGVSSGQGLFTTTVAGSGVVAVLTDGPAIALEVDPAVPLVVDPDAYVAHRGQLATSFVTDVSWKTVIGEGSGEAFSLRFDGAGVVLIQPAERGR